MSGIGVGQTLYRQPHLAALASILIKSIGNRHKAVGAKARQNADRVGLADVKPSGHCRYVPLFARTGSKKEQSFELGNGIDVPDYEVTYIVRNEIVRHSSIR